MLPARHIPGALVAMLLLWAGCGRGPARTPEELAAALRREGIAYEVAETAALPRIDAPGLRLRGDGISIEIYRIENEKHRKLAASAAALAAGGQGAVEGEQPLRPLLRGPFLVIVREEPAPGQVQSALARVLPE